MSTIIATSFAQLNNNDMKSKSFQNWEDYYSDDSYISDNEDDLSNELFHELTNEELDEISKNNIKYIEYKVPFIQKAPTPITYKQMSDYYKNNSSKLDSLNTNQDQDKIKIKEKEEQDNNINSYLNWVKPDFKPDVKLNVKPDVELIVEVNENMPDSDSEDDEYFYKWVSKNKTIKKPEVVKSLPSLPVIKEQKKVNINNTISEFPLLGTKDIKESTSPSIIENEWLTTKTKVKNIKAEINTNTKTRRCKIKNCSNGKNCSYAHSFEELNIKKCIFNDTCRNIKKENGLFYNKMEDNICEYIHQDETNCNYKFRLGFSKKLEVEETSSKKTLERSDIFDILSDKTKIQGELQFTKLCKFIKDKQSCPHKDNCRFAHSVKQLRVSNCLFQDKCRLVKYENSIMSNVSKTKICEHLHIGETLDNYYSRIGIGPSKLEKTLSIKKISL